MTTRNLRLGLLPCLALFAAQVALTPALAVDQNASPGQLSAADYKFAREAATGGLMEVALGNIAATNSHNSSVQQFAQRMVNDHGKAGEQLAALAAKKGATLPAQVTAKQQKEIDMLAGLQGGQFDRAYISHMVRMHKMDERAFKQASQTVADPDLKTFAADTLITVQDHLKLAQDIDANLKQAGSTE